VPDWQNFQVVVALGAQARKAFPVRPGKTILFTWSIKDPTAVGSPSDSLELAFEPAYQCLESHIKELLAAILEQPSSELPL
jgi:hypothetical protein